MAGSSVLVPIIVAVIGVVGAVVPLYITNTASTAEIETRLSFIPLYDYYLKNPLYDKNIKEFIIGIGNLGNAPATNLSIILRSCQPAELISGSKSCEFKIHNITNGFRYSRINIASIQQNFRTRKD